MAAPIPRNLLPHSGELFSSGLPNAWKIRGDVKIADLSFIRFDPSAKIIKSSSGEDIQLAAIMFYDVVNSKTVAPADGDTPAQKIAPSFAVRQIIKRGSTRYIIEQIDELYDARRLHHYEILLSGGV